MLIHVDWQKTPVKAKPEDQLQVNKTNAEKLRLN